MDTYRLVCWKSGAVVAFDKRIVNSQVVFYDDTWWAPENYKDTMESIKNHIKQVVEECPRGAGLTSLEGKVTNVCAQ